MIHFITPRSWIFRLLYILFFSCHSQLVASENVQLNLDLSDVTVSGVGSGGYMASQFHLSHSDWVSGIGVISAGPFLCAQHLNTEPLNAHSNVNVPDSRQTAALACVSINTALLDMNTPNQLATTLRQQRKLAALAHTSNDRVWLFREQKQQGVSVDVFNQLVEQYKRWVGLSNIKIVANTATSSAFSTLNNKECLADTPSVTNDCKFDAAGDMLNFLYLDLQARSNTLGGRLIQIKQHGTDHLFEPSMAKSAYLYIPKGCEKNQRCRVHISFHDCNQNSAVVGKKYASNTGINQWADSNGIVVFYPQTRSTLFEPINPQGCWDWWGYSDSSNDKMDIMSNTISNDGSATIDNNNSHSSPFLYATKEGIQISIIEDMLFRINGAN